jgi:hypothetical protein
VKKDLKDLFAALTFLTTAFLFYVTQTHPPERTTLGCVEEGADAGEVLVQGSAPDAPDGLVLGGDGTRDS